MTPDIVILAAGQGKRMRSTLPKVLHPILYRPMLHYVIDLALSIPHGAIVAVVGHGGEKVRESCAKKAYPSLQFVDQHQQLGTGHAALQAKPLLKNLGGKTLVLSGDVMLLQSSSLTQLIEACGDGAAAAVLTAQLKNPTGYGRILRGGSYTFTAIKEEADCTIDERAITEINSGIYVFSSEMLWQALDRVGNTNAQKEYYLTDAVRFLSDQGKRIVAVQVKDSQEILGINDRAALVTAERILQSRINQSWMLSGVTIEQPESTWIDTTTRISSDVRLESGCRIIDSQIADNVTVESESRIVRSTIGKGSIIRQGSYITDSVIGEDVSVGPYAHLRPGSQLGNGVKIGNFVEIKKSTLGPQTKAPHLSYIGDATIGKEVNLGCGFVTCNYDGSPEKHLTIIGDRVFIGSDSQTVAPVEIGDDSYIASGTTVTENVPRNSLALSRGRQITKPGYAKKYRKGDR